jgi:predicted enzyme related to lactoylglutathione lyase
LEQNEATVMQNPVGWFEIYVEDLPRAKAFYERVFDVELSKLDMPGVDMLSFPLTRDASGASGALIRMPGFKPGVGGVLVYFVCEDCGKSAAKAAEAGGRVQKEKFAIGGYGFIALVIDSEGNMIGLHSTH